MRGLCEKASRLPRPHKMRAPEGCRLAICTYLTPPLPGGAEQGHAPVTRALRGRHRAGTFSSASRTSAPASCGDTCVAVGCSCYPAASAEPFATGRACSGPTGSRRGGTQQPHATPPPATREAPSRHAAWRPGARRVRLDDGTRNVSGWARSACLVRRHESGERAWR